MSKVELLSQKVNQLLSTTLIQSSIIKHNELTITIDAKSICDVLQLLKDDPQTHFEQCVDLCGVDYLDYKNSYTGKRFAVVYHLLSLKHNWRIRVKALIADDKFPLINTVDHIYSSANWFEREAFDLYGIMFEGHPDLRRILTDYGFVGHPFRKDFPLSGYVEMRYDEEQKRVVYQPVTIEPREITPRVIREDSYSGRN
jgi:NADH-quinone oxidoreductase subunit C